jgi:hypothetical protein
MHIVLRWVDYAEGLREQIKVMCVCACLPLSGDQGRASDVRSTLRAVQGLLWEAIKALVGAFKKDYWWPILRDLLGL